MNRRKYDTPDQEIHEKLWAKWQLESLEFFEYKDNDIPEVPEFDDITIFLKAA